MIGSVGADLTERAGVARGAVSYVYALLVSTALIFLLLWSLYHLLTNVRLPWRESLPGAAFAAVLLQGSFQLLPLFVRLSQNLIALQAYGGLVLLLVWLYLMANVIVLGRRGELVAGAWAAGGRGRSGLGVKLRNRR